MKKCTALLLGLIVTCALRAQTREEWLEQKETQIRYLREGLTALKSYGELVQKGYRIAREGLSAIGKIKQGDLWLHQERIASLSGVYPSLQDSGWVEGAEALLAALQTHSARQLRLLAGSGQFTPAEIGYHAAVYERLLEQGRRITGDIRILCSEGGAELTHGERLRLLRDRTAALREHYTLARHFAAGSVRLALQRYREAGTIRSLRGLHRPN